MNSSVPRRAELRLESFDRAMRQLTIAVERVSPSDDDDISLQEEGLIQRFEYCFELAWKLLKDIADESTGMDDLRVAGPRAAIMWAQTSGWVRNGELWLSMLRSRNVTTHVYDRVTIQPILNLIRGLYFTALNELRERARNYLAPDAS